MTFVQRSTRAIENERRDWKDSPEQFRFLNKSHHDPIGQKAQHGRKPLAIEQEEGKITPPMAIQGLPSHHAQSLYDKAQTQSEHDASNNRLGRDLLDPGNGSGQSHEKPEKPGKDSRPPDHSRGDRPGMGDGHPSDCFHGLNRDRGPEIKSHKNFEDAEGDKNPQRVHLIERDISHDKRDQRAQIAKGPGKLHLVVVIPPQSHG